MENLWNKKDMMNPISVYCNERPHLDIWAKEKEEERRQMEIELEKENYEKRRKKIEAIKKDEAKFKVRRESV